MTQTMLVDLMQQTVWIIVLLSAPVLLVSMGVGLIISIFQAVTQIQEATLTFVPKILLSLLVFVVTGPWLVETIVTFSGRLFENLLQYAH